MVNAGTSDRRWGVLSGCRQPAFSLSAHVQKSIVLTVKEIVSISDLPSSLSMMRVTMRWARISRPSLKRRTRRTRRVKRVPRRAVVDSEDPSSLLSKRVIITSNGKVETRSKKNHDWRYRLAMRLWSLTMPPPFQSGSRNGRRKVATTVCVCAGRRACVGGRT